MMIGLTSYCLCGKIICFKGDEMNLNDEFKFGKYKGYTLKEVLNYDPQYVMFCINSVHNFKLCDESKTLVQEKYASWVKSQNSLKVGYNVSLFME